MTVYLQHARWEMHVTEVNLIEETRGGVYQHVYRALCENGHVDELYEEVYMPSQAIELDDRLWNEGSGWGDFQCDACEYIHHERCYPGMFVECPRCGTAERVPEGAELVRSHIE